MTNEETLKALQAMLPVANELGYDFRVAEIKSSIIIMTRDKPPQLVGVQSSVELAKAYLDGIWTERERMKKSLGIGLGL